jgi:hypothetical protein
MKLRLVQDSYSGKINIEVWNVLFGSGSWTVLGHAGYEVDGIKGSYTKDEKTLAHQDFKKACDVLSSKTIILNEFEG